MKNILLFIFALFFTVSAWAAPVDGTHVVALFENESPELVARFHGVGRIKTWHRFQAGRWGALSGFTCSPNANQIERMQRDTRVQFIETNVIVYALSQTIPTGVRRIGCLSNTRWINSSTTPIDVDVAVIDTGIDLTHPDLNVYQNVTFVTGTTTGNDDNGHGSHCAGIVGAKNDTSGVVGVAPGVRLWAVKVLDSGGSGALSQIISGVDYVTAHAAEIEVASMSLGGQGGPTDSLRLAIQNSVARGVVYVVAAGNSFIDVYGGDCIFGTSDDFFPSSYPEVMAVSALVDTDGQAGGLGPSTSRGPDDTTANFSNFSKQVSGNFVTSPGAAIDVAAPGVDIYSTYKNGGYYTMSGTSMACPHVSGAVALYIAQYGRASTASGVYAIRQAIINAAEPQTAWGINPIFNDGKPEGLVHVSNYAVAPDYPTVAISSPPSNIGAATGTALRFTGSAIDPVDGDISGSIYWKSSVQGAIGTGATFTLALNAGTHTITATATNAAGNVGRATVTGIVISAPVYSPPTVTLTSPTAGTYPTNTVLTFTGTAADTYDGNITSQLTWNSSVDGPIGTGGSFTRTLSVGTHIISCSATNHYGKWSSASVSGVIVGAGTPPPPINQSPTVSITSPPNGATYPQGSTVPIYGTASDPEDGDLSSVIRWNGPSGVFAVGSNASTNGLAVGTNTITANVQDSNGAQATASRTVIVTATNAPAVVLSVTVTTDRTSYVNKMKAQVRATVTANGSPVSGASCNFTIRGASGKTQTKSGVLTSTAGVASYIQNIQSGQLGVGTATITATATKAGTVSGIGSTTISITR